MPRLYRWSIEIFISQCKEIVKGLNPNSYVAATSYGSIPLIEINRIPKSEHTKIEQYVEEIVAHETIHITVSRIENNATSHAIMDKCFPFMGDLEKYLNS